MAVYERAYRAYTGPLTPERWRFLILPRYAVKDVFRSRIFAGFFALCFVAPLVFSIFIYLRHNLSALKVLDLSQSNLVPIDASFFLFYVRFQGFLSFLMTLIVGPALVAPDLRNQALPLYFARPFSRTEYVAGKMVVLVSLMSAITWLPGFVLFALQSYLEGIGWMWSNLRIGVAIFVASWVWILVLSLLALAISATVKWKPVAAATLLVLFFVAAAAGAAFNATFGTSLGSVLSIGQMVIRVWEGLFGIEPASDFPVWMAWGTLVVTCGISLRLLSRKLRAYEVVR